MLGFSWMKSYRRCVPVAIPRNRNAWHEVLSRVVDDAFLLQFNKSVREHLGEAAQMLLAFQTCGDSVDDAADAQLNGVAIVYAIDDELCNLCLFRRRCGHLYIFEQLFLHYEGIDGAYVIVVRVAEYAGKARIDLRNDVLCATQCALFNPKGPMLQLP